MLRRVAILAIGCLLGCSSDEAHPPGSGPPPPPPSEEEVVARLGELSEAPPQARLVNGLVRGARMRVPVGNLGGGTAQQAATQLVSGLADAFGIADVAVDLTVGIADSHGAGTVVVFERRIAGRPVIGAQIRVNLEDVGGSGPAVRSVSAALPSIGTLANANPGVSQAAAIAAAAASRSGPSTWTTVGADLAVYNPGVWTGEAVANALVWRVLLSPSQGPGTVEVYVDARSGQVLGEAPRFSAAHRYTYSAGGIRSALEVMGDYVVGDPGGRYVGENQLWFTDASSSPVASSCQITDWQRWLCDGEGTPSAVGSAVHQRVAQVAAYFSGRFGVDGIDRKGHAVHAFVHYGLPDNAYYEPRYELKELPDGEIANFARPGGLFFGEGWTSLDIVTHEYTHGLSATAWGRSPPEGQPLAIAEGLSDVFAAFRSGEWVIRMDRTCTHPGIHPDDPCTKRWLGVDSSLNLRGRLALTVGGAIQPYDPARSQHYNSGIISRVAQLLETGGDGTGAYWVNDKPVQPVARGKLEQIFFRAMTLYMGGTESFADARYALLNACTPLAESSGSDVQIEDCGAILNAFHAVGVGPPDEDLDTWHDEIDNCPQKSNYGQEDQDGDGTGDACESQPPPDWQCPGSYGSSEGGAWSLQGSRPSYCSNDYCRRSCTYNHPSDASKQITFQGWWMPKSCSACQYELCGRLCASCQGSCERLSSTVLMAEIWWCSVPSAEQGTDQARAFAQQRLGELEALALTCQ